MNLDLNGFDARNIDNIGRNLMRLRISSRTMDQELGAIALGMRFGARYIGGSLNWLIGPSTVTMRKERMHAVEENADRKISNSGMSANLH